MPLPVFVRFFFMTRTKRATLAYGCASVSYTEVTRLFTRLNAARLLNFQLFDMRFMLGLRLFDSGSHS